MYRPLVEDLLKHQGEGSICVLSRTNEEALILVALLRKYGLNSKLIQSTDDIRFWNMAEVRMFLKLIERGVHGPVIADDVWEEAKEKTFAMYASSSSLPYLQRCLSLFEQTNTAKYYTDFREFVFESTVEDFCDLSGADVVVSTIHKAKGREFDDVYMLISGHKGVRDIDEELRGYYVGATRAKTRLFIHTDTTLFDRIPADEHLICQERYSMPDEIVLQLSHRDVNLGFFKGRKNEILSLRAGQPLNFANNYLYGLDGHTVLAKLSRDMQGKLLQWVEKGYQVVSATIRFIGAWRPKDAPKEEKEHAVLLVDLMLRRKV